MGIEVRPTTEEDIPAIARVLSQAALHKAQQDDFLWGTEPYDTKEVEAKLQAGGLFTVTQDGTIAGTVTITDKDSRVWEDDGTNDEALYIH